jgi:uracil-DNA glycosylase
MTDLAQLQTALLQTLENYQRSGLGRVPRLRAESLPKEFFDWLSTQRAATTADEVANETRSREIVTPVADPTVQPNRITTAQPTARETVAKARSTAAVATSSSPWGLPLLDLESRQLQLDQVKSEVQACRRCTDIVCYRRQTVFGTGPLTPTVVFMGEAPGADEDQQGVPFVGRAGQLLTKIISAMQLKREEVFILNALKCRPPQNRTPSPEEIEACRPYVQTQLEILQPQFIVCLGAVAVRSLLGLTQSVGGLRGQFHQYRQARVIVTYHPSYLLRNESAKKLVWQDMQMLMKELGLKPPA